MGQRLDLQHELQQLIGARSDGKQNVYFQPPESIKLVYPCIIYKRTPGQSRFADDLNYRFVQSYQLTIIDKDPDSPLFEKIRKAFQMIRHDSFFVTENLSHDVYTLYY